MKSPRLALAALGGMVLTGCSAAPVPGQVAQPTTAHAAASQPAATYRVQSYGYGATSFSPSYGQTAVVGIGIYAPWSRYDRYGRLYESLYEFYESYAAKDKDKKQKKSYDPDGHGYKH